MIIDSGQHAPVEPVMPYQMAELADHRLVCCSFIANINAREVTHGGAIMTAVFGLRVRHFEALLQDRYAQQPAKARSAGGLLRPRGDGAQSELPCGICPGTFLRSSARAPNPYR